MLMKRLYHLLLLLGLLSAMPIVAMAQSTSGNAYLGYAQYTDDIWEYDGLSLDHTAKVGCAIVLTREMLAPYIGGTIVGMRVGWDTSTRTGSYTGFVRSTFNGEDLTSSKPTTVSYSYSSSAPGWNNLTLTSYEIPEDVEQLVVGFTTTLQKDVCAIPTLYPHNTPNSCYLWVDGDNDEEGNPLWRDMNDRGILPILLRIRDSKGTFNYVPSITLLTHSGVVATDEASDCLVRVKNIGSQAISSIEVTSRQGEQSYSQRVNLSSAIAVGSTSKSFLVPLWCFHTGDLELSITKANNKEIANPEVHKLNLIGVPRAVDETYIRRPLVEYYESENSYMSPRYYDDYVGPSLEGMEEDLTFVCQHMDDQFMTGEDDATALALRLCDNDSSQVSIPAMTIDRGMSTDNILFQQNATQNPMFSVLIGDYAKQTLNAALQHPTFLDVNVSGEITDGETLQVSVGGEIAEGVMPEGEKPRLTVYLMERNVDTDSQIFWTEKEKEEYMGQYTHANVIREVLTAPEGDEIDGEGKISASYTTELIPDWNRKNLYLVAFVHRDGSRGGKYMYVFNSNEGAITDPTGIEGIQDSRFKIQNDAVYDLSGRRVSVGGDLQSPTSSVSSVSSASSVLPKGIYIQNGKKVIK